MLFGSTCSWPFSEENPLRVASEALNIHLCILSCNLVEEWGEGVSRTSDQIPSFSVLLLLILLIPPLSTQGGVTKKLDLVLSLWPPSLLGPVEEFCWSLNQPKIAFWSFLFEVFVSPKTTSLTPSTTPNKEIKQIILRTKFWLVSAPPPPPLGPKFFCIFSDSSPVAWAIQRECWLLQRENWAQIYHSLTNSERNSSMHKHSRLSGGSWVWVHH